MTNVISFEEKLKEKVDRVFEDYLKHIELKFNFNDRETIEECVKVGEKYGYPLKDNRDIHDAALLSTLMALVGEDISWEEAYELSKYIDTVIEQGGL